MFVSVYFVTFILAFLILLYLFAKTYSRLNRKERIWCIIDIVNMPFLLIFFNSPYSLIPLIIMYTSLYLRWKKDSDIKKKGMLKKSIE